MSVTLNGTSGLVFGDGTSQPTAGFTRFRNKIINGNCAIDQRNAGAALSCTSAAGAMVRNTGVAGEPLYATGYAADRFLYAITSEAGQAGVSWQRVADAPANTGLKYCVRLTVNTAKTSTGAGDRAHLRYNIESNDCADLMWGTAAAKAITVSFYVKSSIVGTYSYYIINGNETRSYVAPFTISQANTWERKVITIPGDTTGTWYNETITGQHHGMRTGISFGDGTTYQAPSTNTWNSGWYYNHSGTTKIVNTAGATFSITGYQLEIGTQATEFEHRPYDIEMSMCQRYFQTSYWNAAVGTPSVSGYMTRYLDAAHYYANFPVMLKVPMRTAPSCAIWSLTGISGRITTDSTTTVASMGAMGNHSAICGVSNLLIGQSVSFAFHYTADAEIS